MAGRGAHTSLEVSTSKMTSDSFLHVPVSSEYPLAATVGPSLGAAAAKSRSRAVMPMASDALETLLNCILEF